MDDKKAEPEGGHRSSFANRARSVLAGIEDDDRVKKAAEATRQAAAGASELSQSLSRKVTQEDSWDELRGDVEELTAIARAHHALIVDLLDRVEALEGGRGSAR